MAFRLKMAGAFLLALLWLGVGFVAPASAACPAEKVTVAVQQAPKALVKVTIFGTEAEEADPQGPESLSRPAQPVAEDLEQMAAGPVRPSGLGTGAGRPGPSTCQRAVMFSFPQDRPPNA